MNDSASENIAARLGLSRPPIAIGFLTTVPEGVAAWNGGSVPAGCVFWDKAMNGDTFYTVASDHHNCAVGAYVHKMELPAERAHELGDTLTFMDANNYVSMAEVPSIPTLAASPQFVAYGPVDSAAFTPDVVLVAAKPAQAMLIYEASIKAGASTGLANALGRPACAVLPLTISTGQTSISLGCRGNRTFTALVDDEMYVSVPGDKWAAVVAALTETETADATMTAHYEGHKATFA
jgi:uncharacterized protein (DUF169 family)